LRLKALLKAFQLRTRLADFHEGRWIDYGSAAYDKFLEAAEAENPDHPRERWETKRHRFQLQFVFCRLLDYRVRLESALCSAAMGWCVDGAGLYAYRRTGAVNEVIREKLSVIEDPLALIISPENRSFQVADLAREFGYPDVNLLDIDLSWI
jgi:hypothetical protein